MMTLLEALELADVAGGLLEALELIAAPTSRR